MNKYVIATAPSRVSVRWTNRETSWDDLAERLSTVLRTSETVREYAAMSRDDKGKAKDKGGFVGGPTKDGHRRKGSVPARHLLTLDLDNVEPHGLDSVMDDIDLRMESDYVVYSTHSHTPERPRLRLVAPLSRPCSADEYEAVARRIAERIGIGRVDRTTYQAERLMYWPSCPSDGEFVCHDGSGIFGPVDVDRVLATYADWRDVSSWPRSREELESPLRPSRPGARQQDPTTKEGLIGAFCRAYDIHEAIGAFLPDIYERVSDNRYTYTGGSTFGGAVTYDDRYIYSNHQTDPAGLQLCNAWDLVRIHLFGGEDDPEREYSQPGRRPSWKAMERLAMDDRRTRSQMVEDRFGGIGDDSEKDQKTPKSDQKAPKSDQKTPKSDQTEEEDRSWLEPYLTKNGIAPKPTLFSAILENDPRLKGLFATDRFLRREVLTRMPPWAHDPSDMTVSDADLAQLRIHIASRYCEVKGESLINDAVTAACERNAVNVLQDRLNALPRWDGTPRAETVLIDYLGAEDTELTRAITLRMLLAAYTRAFKPGTKFDQMVVIYGGQGIGKSTLSRLLALDDNWFTDSMPSPDNDKEAAQHIQGKWFVEVAELAKMKNADIDQIKNFLSKTHDDYRPSYGKKTVHRARTCIFIGTTNTDGFLRDRTGERRYWPVDCTRGEKVRSVWEDDFRTQIVPQVWAEIREIYKEGRTSLMLPKELQDQLDLAQSAHKEEDTWPGIIEEFLDTPLPEAWYQMSIMERRQFFLNPRFKDGEECRLRRDSVSVAEIANECYLLGLTSAVKRADSNHVIEVLKALGWVSSGSSRRSGYGLQRVLSRPEIEPEEDDEDWMR